MRGFTRRAFMGAGCLWAMACNQRPGVNFPFDTADPQTGDTSVPPVPEGYPCEQAVPDGSGRIPLPLDDYPDLAEVGGWYPLTTPAGAIVVAHVDEGCYVAILRACTHEGVPIDYRPERGQFVCPRHGAVYDWRGRKVAGPQPRDLPVYQVAREGDTVFVDVDQLGER
ncbi:MAG: Rieske (2Fe-2S) protein [Myxococcales bacterium]|nr:Rieske (2Fe-2S) protein [Myxococcales bacterium]